MNDIIFLGGNPGSSVPRSGRRTSRLFEREGKIYTQFVLHERLERMCRMLRNPRFMR
jgi:hypothetical protein